MANPNASIKFRLPRNKYRKADKNQLLESQALYHVQTAKFAELLDLLVELEPEQSREICEAYKYATMERLYNPLLKAFMKDLQALVTCKAAPVTLQTCARFRATDPQLVVRFESVGPSTKSNTGDAVTDAAGGAAANEPPRPRVLYSWRVFEVALLLLCPLVDAEEAFIKVCCMVRCY